MNAITLVDASGQAVQLPQSTTLIRRVVISTAAALVDSPVDFNTGYTNKISTVIAMAVIAASGAGTKKLKFGSPAEQAVDLLATDPPRNDLAIGTGLYFTTDGAGGSITLEIHGRP